MYDWLSRQVRLFTDSAPERRGGWQLFILDRFIDWLEATGASPWRSVEHDGYPAERSDTTEYFVHCIAEGYTTAVYADRALWELLEVTHWMPIPLLV